ncbi:MAG: LytTR family transcriptional regulator DNA-binding domain-containing protein, partial [Clostridiales bacterium]|nr:LytTR family transcriptional regulator DNA-binding domain-containing protein [Clostridiales bacterium]
CMRPAGILLAPFREEAMRMSLDRALRDYTALYEQEGQNGYMTLTSGKTLRRIAYRDIQYLEAQDKLLNICTKRYAVSVRGSLNAVEKELPQEFIRCHRSYIVNRLHIERLNLPEMAVYLANGERIPVSRSYKEALLEQLRAEDQV